MGKLAILQMADTPQIESSAQMLRHAGYEVKVCGEQLRTELVKAGCDTVLAVKSMTDVGYDPLDPSIKEASPADMDRCDLFCEIKVRNIPKVWKRWPRLGSKAEALSGDGLKVNERALFRTCWWRVNGARPEHVIKPDGKGNMEDCGDEVNPPCPVITADMWYGKDQYNPHGSNYTFWPPYPRSKDYNPNYRTTHIAGVGAVPRSHYNAPFCLCHGINGWGYYAILARCVAMGVDVYGVNAPKGILPHSKVPDLVHNGLCMVHIKSVDCPGWAIYESMLAGCPVVVSRLLINRMQGFDLFEEGVTCLAFGVPGDETGRGDMKFDQCVMEIAEAIDKLKDPAINNRIGMAGCARLHDLMWREDHPDGYRRDGEGFKQFMTKWFA